MPDSKEILQLPAPEADVRLHYGSDAQQFGDLRLPARRGPFPVVVYIHGGFWRAAFDLLHAGHVCHALTQAGWATWNLEYRRIGQPGGGWPGTADDVLSGCGHLQQLAQEHPLDLNRVVIAGHSAGGHLALWAAAQRKLSLVGVTALAPVCDLRRTWELKLSNNVVEEFMGGSPENRSAEYSLASPIELLPMNIGQRLAHGTADANVPVELSERFARASANCRLITLEGAGHFEVIDPRSREWPVVQDSVLNW